jgi:chemotaxis protein methyltransferase CheR
MSEPILKKARSGLYSDFEVNRGLSEQRLQRWFTRDGANWRIAPALQQMVTFRAHNLLQPAAALGTFDVILCRNVLIYFDVAQKRKILDELARMMPPDGQLFLGSAETVIGVTDAFELTPDAKGLYRLARAQERQVRIA